MQSSDFDFELPPELIAQFPVSPRDHSRLMVLNRANHEIRERSFHDLLDYLNPGDALVLNNSKVIPARLTARTPSGGKCEVFLLRENSVNDWWTMMKPGKKGTIGTRLNFCTRRENRTKIFATVEEVNEEGHRRVKFSGTLDVRHELDLLGEIPLPPYIDRAQMHEDDKERYQTVYAQFPGSVAAPTAGLHFTDNLLRALNSRGVRVCFVTLHVGLGTFAPVKVEALSEHRMHEEFFELAQETASGLNRVRQEGGKIFAVGTTTVRVLESVARGNDGKLVATCGSTKIFIYPPADFRIVDALITNFHLPRSTLLALVSAFAAPGRTEGREFVLTAYKKAIEERFRFFSYGDAMLLL